MLSWNNFDMPLVWCTDVDTIGKEDQLCCVKSNELCGFDRLLNLSEFRVSCDTVMRS